MHAVVVTVSVEQNQLEAARKALKEQVVPRVRGSKGFLKGYWTAGADQTQGLSLVVFDSEQNARDAANMVRANPTPPGVTLRNVEVREVIADA